MKKSLVTVIAVLGACFMAAQGAEAKTLEDILKEKGVITEADYKEVTKVKPFDYKLGKGFTLTSPDERFQLTLGGRMQFCYTFTDYDSNSTASDSSTFNAKRIRLIFQGYAYSMDLTYKLEIDPRVLATSSSAGGLLDAYMNYKFMNEVQLLVGQTKVKYSYTVVQSDSMLMFVDRVPWIGKMVPCYEIGAFAHGSVADDFLSYALSATNGDGQTYAANTNHNAFAARVVLSPLGKMSTEEADLAIGKKPLFTIGADYYYNNLNVGESK